MGAVIFFQDVNFGCSMQRHKRTIIIIRIYSQGGQSEYYKIATNNISTDYAIIGGYNGPTNIFITQSILSPVIPVSALILTVISIVGIYKTRKK